MTYTLDNYYKWEIEPVSFCLGIFAGLIVLSVFLIAIMAPPSQEDVTRCVESTNYSTERCVLEMTR